MARARSVPASIPAVAALLAAAACHPKAPPQDLSLEPAELLAQVRLAQARVTAVQGDARVRVDGPGMKGTLPQFIAAQRPDRLHIEALDFFGNPAAVLTAGDGRFALYDARARVFYRGEATPENLARLLPLPLRAEELVAILCGSAPLLDATAARADPGRGFVQLVLDDGARTQSLRIGERATVERSAVRSGGRQPPGAYDLSFEIFRTMGGARFPTDLTLRAGQPRVRLDLHWRDVEVNGAVDGALFRMEPPRGARVVDLREEEAPPLPTDLFRPAPEPAPAPPPERPPEPTTLVPRE
jgi:hypothetical protein